MEGKSIRAWAKMMVAELPSGAILGCLYLATAAFVWAAVFFVIQPLFEE